ncbi:MAG: malto-oligosyltrehalose trehalohydrolase [Candidatus Omnitrophota bacterium]
MMIGAHYIDDNKCEFTVWAPFLNDVSLKIVSPDSMTIPMQKDEQGYWRIIVENIHANVCYLYELDHAQEKPDPASFYQPKGVHGPSQVINHKNFSWGDGGWNGISIDKMIIYELHVGTFTPEGTFDAIIPRLEELVDLGINTIEVMPVAQFPGTRNWGYDGVYPYAVQNSYGGPDGFKRFINACHKKGIAVILDVVYNHLGPEGNYLCEFAPYFTNKYYTPWGNAINFDDAYSPGVRNYFIENALSWLENYHVDGLRLDAVHSIYDFGAKHILEELAEKIYDLSVQKTRKLYLIAESNLNDIRIIKPVGAGGYGIDAQWCDDFHHCLHVLLTGEQTGYYADYGSTGQMVKSLREGFVYSGQYSSFRKKCYGSSSKDIPANQLIVFSQNHDQVGNRMLGDRLSGLVSFEALKLAAAATILSVYTPMIFMGQEYGEETPFQYFVDHSDEDLIAAVRRGRKEEFAAFKWSGNPPDPQDEGSFLASKLKWEQKNEGRYKILWQFYKILIMLKKRIPAISDGGKTQMEVSYDETKKLIFWRRWYKRSEIFCIMNFSKEDAQCRIVLPLGKWKRLINSSQEQWMGKGALLPEYIENNQEIQVRSFGIALYEKELLK